MALTQHRLKGGAVVGSYRLSFSTLFLEESESDILEVGIAGETNTRIKFRNVSDHVRLDIGGTNNLFVKQVSGILSTVAITCADVTDIASLYAPLSRAVPTGGTNSQVLTIVSGSPAWAAAGSAPVTSVNGETGAVSLSASDVDADPIGTAAGAVAAHINEEDPHTGYRLESVDVPLADIYSAGATNGHVLTIVSGTPAWAAAWSAPVTSVNGETGSVSLDAADVGAEASGAVAAHAAETDPHTGYRLESANVPWTEVSGKPSTFAPSAHASSHQSGNADELTIVMAQVDGLTAALQGKLTNGAVTIVAGTGLTGGGTINENASATRTLTVDFGTTSTTVCVGNDSRLSDSRAPSGSAGGDLTGTYPNPTLASVITAASKGAAAKTITLTYDAKGRVTTVADTDIDIAGEQVTSGTLPIARIGTNAITNAKLAQIATATFKGRTTASTGDVEDLTVTQATALLNAMVADSGSGGTKGLVPAPSSGDGAAKKVLQADATWGYAAAIKHNTATFSGTGTHTIDFSVAQQQFDVVTVSSSITLTIAASNITANRHCSLVIENTSGGTVTISWSGFAATPLGAALPTTLATGKSIAIALSARSTTAASVCVTSASQS